MRWIIVLQSIPLAIQIHAYRVSRIVEFTLNRPRKNLPHYLPLLRTIERQGFDEQECSPMALRSQYETKERVK